MRRPPAVTINVETRVEPWVRPMLRMCRRLVRAGYRVDPTQIRDLIAERGLRVRINGGSWLRASTGRPC